MTFTGAVNAAALVKTWEDALLQTPGFPGLCFKTIV